MDRQHTRRLFSTPPIEKIPISKKDLRLGSAQQTHVHHTCTLSQWAEHLRQQPGYRWVGLTAKAWLLPDGVTIQPLGGQMHDTWLQSHQDVARRFGLTAADLEGDHQQVRIAALLHGFIRVAWERSNGRLTIEGIDRHYTGTAKSALFMLIADNAEAVDRVTLNVLSGDGCRLVVTTSQDLFTYDGPKKLDHLPEALAGACGFITSSTKSGRD
jgi:hypothetical protein